MKVSIYISSQSGADGKYPLKISLRHRGEAAYIPLGIRVQKKQWRKVSADGNHIIDSPNARQYNAFIKRKLIEAENIIMHLQSSSEVATRKMSVKQIRDYVQERLSPALAINDDAAQRNCVIFYGNRLCATKRKQSTKDTYQHTLSRVCAFLGEVEANKITFDDINVHWLSRFDAWLEANGNAINTRSIHFRNLRAIFNDAIDNDVTTNYPFRKFKIRSEPTTKRSLTLDELRTLWNAPTDERTSIALDIFKLSFYLLGVNMVDMYNLTQANIVNGRLVYRRAKTGKLYDIAIPPEAMEIIDKWRGNGDTLLCLRQRWRSHKDATHRINELLQMIGTYHIEAYNARIYEPIFPHLTMYWARHSWATLASRLDIPIDTIAHALGHSYGNATTAIYIDASLDKVDKANRRVIDAVLAQKPDGEIL